MTNCKNVGGMVSRLNVLLISTLTQKSVKILNQNKINKPRKAVSRNESKYW